MNENVYSFITSDYRFIAEKQFSSITECKLCKTGLYLIVIGNSFNYFCNGF